MGLTPLVAPGPSLSPAQVARYARHVLIPDVGLEGQRRLAASKVLVVGAGGLGSPALLYLAAAGVGTIGIADADVVETSNLQRQVVHGVADVGRLKTESAAETIAASNPFVHVVRHDLRLDASNALEVIEGYDLVVDGTDNFPTRYLVNDACVLLGKPHVWGSIYRFDGQVSVWWAAHGPCYRCVFPEPPPPGLVPSCAEGGVLGVLCAAIGSVQATEAVKLLVGIGEPLVGRLVVHDALRQSWDTLTVRKDPGCAVCGEAPTVTGLVDYQDFCGIPPDVRGAAPPSGSPDGGGADEEHVGVAMVSARELAELLAARDGAHQDGAHQGADREDRDRQGQGGRSFVLVDVRGEHERAIVSIPGSVAIHLDEFRSGAALSRLPDDRPVIVHCRSGARSAEAAELLRATGHPDVRDLAGGVLAWVRDVDPTQPLY